MEQYIYDKNNSLWYVHFYNYERINMKDGLTPHEIRCKAA